MSFFDYARDFYSSYWLPQKLAWEMGLALIFLVIAFAGFHLLRRGLGAPVPRDEGAPLPPAPRSSSDGNSARVSTTGAIS